MSQPVQDNANIIIDNLNTVLNPTTINPTTTTISPSPSLAKSADQVVIDQLNRLILPPEPRKGCSIIGNITFTLNGKLIVIKSAEFCTGAAQGKRLIHDGVTEDGKQTAIVSNKDKYVQTTNGSTTNGPTNKLSQSQNYATTRQNLDNSKRKLELEIQKTSDPQIKKKLNEEIINIQQKIVELNVEELKLQKNKNVTFANQGDSSSSLNIPFGAEINSAKSSSHNLVGDIVSHDLSTDSSAISSSHDLVGKSKIISYDL